MEKIEEQNTHRIGVTVTDPNHPMVSKRKETIQKTVRASGTKDEAINKAISHLKRKGYKVHDHHYIGTVNEEVIKEAKSTSGVYEKAQENKQSADAAKKQGDMFTHHMHMADHHENMSQWHSEEGRHNMADIHAEKAEQHHEKAMHMKEGRDAYQRDEYSSKQGFGRRRREDDEYHTPDPTTTTHRVGFHVSKDGGEKHHRTVTISNSRRSPEEAKSAARAHLEKQGYKIHEEVGQVDEISKDLANRYMYSAFTDRKKTDDKMFALRDRQDTLGHNNRNKISKLLKKSDKRTAGISRALDRVTKEEITNEAETYDYHMQRAQSAEKRGDMKAKVLHLKRAQAASNERLGMKEEVVGFNDWLTGNTVKTEAVFQSKARLRLADALRKEQEKREAEEARREKKEPEEKSEKNDKD